MTTPRHARVPEGGRRRGVGFWLLLVLGVGLVLFVGAFAWDAYQLLGSKDALSRHAAAAKDALDDRDAGALSVEVRDLETAARTFASATDGPHWWIAAHLPWVSNQVIPLMSAGTAVDAVASDALAPLAGLGSLEALEAPAFVDGRIDPDTLEPYREVLATAADTLDAQSAVLAAVDLGSTVDAVAGPFSELRAQVDTLQGIVQGGHVAAELLPSMLGGDGARTYLVMVQNNAEPRTTGGIPGAVIEVTVDDGRLTQGRYASATSMVVRDGVGGLTEDEERIFTAQMEIYPHDVNVTPEFPRSAEMMTRFWKAEYGEDVDGVVSIDPVALGWMLKGAGSTTIDGIKISAANLADVMLNESYFQYENPADQDAFFARASAELFGRIVSGEANALGGVERAIDAGRFLLWSGDESEQDLLGTTDVAGAFLEEQDTLGLFLNDGSGSKIGYYVDKQTTVTNRVCTDGSVAGQTVNLTLTHTYGGDVADLPDYIAGGRYVPAGEFHVNVLLFPQDGMRLVQASLDGEGVGINSERLDGRELDTLRVVLTPGQSATLEFQLDAGTTGLLPAEVRTTPGSRADEQVVVAEEPADGC